MHKQYIKFLNKDRISITVFLFASGLKWFNTVLVARKVFIMAKEKQNDFNIFLVPLSHFLKFLSHRITHTRVLDKTCDPSKVYPQWIPSLPFSSLLPP